jgi:hypothetical protein
MDAAPIARGLMGDEHLGFAVIYPAFDRGSVDHWP